MRKERKHYTAEEKVAILRRHLLDKEPVSGLCEELGLQPTVFYRWQKEFFENGAAAFQSQERPHRQVEDGEMVEAYLIQSEPEEGQATFYYVVGRPEAPAKTPEEYEAWFERWRKKAG